MADAARVSGTSWGTFRPTPYVMLAPFLVLFCVFFVFPFLYSLYLSFQVQHGARLAFAGLQNFAQVLQDESFWASVGRVAYFSLLNVVLTLVVALSLALLVDSPAIKSKSLFRLIYFLPYAVPGVVAAIMWGFLYSPQLDPLLGVLKVFPGGRELQPLAARNVLYAIVNMGVWQWAGYNMTIYYANLTSIPLELYDAAKVDGYNEAQIAILIKVPLLRPTIILTAVLSIIGSLQLFNDPFVLSSLTTISPDFTPNLYIYQMAFAFSNFTYSATLSVVLIVITVVVSAFFMYATSESRSERGR